ncbi:hypothetical protein ACUY3K_00805 [Corynebacterium uberis]|uniref:hypothetical protein n=1 Tax=Corynebacterium TaxID=1716 RepID=UPI001D0A0EBE|nr:hypothetical protein [Corynebacterium uberis]MCZ9309029.1 hypothetical protein [Corynebacterium sp. c6VSa_13]UDL74504.1 hypothetical protein LH391_04750 [Corynebacterium uberis]UDL76661.1 hypothetical protein LH393_04645 [Corynebacterium uberis]UDL78874.1 hypothetical protein LH394_04635 [Corynebacterium uberis]UDL81152.1 hypothetical protein LH392_05055 [Corynebacterium uberis]
MNITDTPNAVGTANATEDVYHHIKPGRTRAPLLRYFRFNLPRLTKAALLACIAVCAACAAGVARSSHLPFAHGQIALWLVVAAAVIFLAFGLCTQLRVWDLGALVASGALVVYIGGLVGTAPYVGNGASVELAATWNLMALSAVAYLVLRAALGYGILVAWPDTQGFTD